MPLSGNLKVVERARDDEDHFRERNRLDPSG
jgi:hypothetical protein